MSDYRRKNEHKGRRVGGDRGLYDYAQIVDASGNIVTVRTSSCATTRAIWIFAKNQDGNDCEPCVGARSGVISVSPHLDVRAAKRLRDALDRFILEDSDV